MTPVVVLVVDLDVALVCRDNNRAKMEKLLAEQIGNVTLDITGPPFYLLRSLKSANGVSARRLVKQYGIETARDYALRSRRGLNVLRQQGKPVPSELASVGNQ